MEQRPDMIWNLPESIAEEVSIPVIASGGAGTLEHFEEVLTDGKADAALAASSVPLQRTGNSGSKRIFA